ncbi:MAG TPA: hypothetical protein PLU17_11915 [Chitinophagaceae bacterium]|nr:hypothetical protein [Chitinophagaceae bacterium]
MKKLILSLSLCLITFIGFSQSENYVKGMKGMLVRLEAAQMNPLSYQEAANGFSRIAAAETKEWLPKYYAAYSLIMQALFTKEKETIDPILDRADNYLSEISESVSNDEVMCLQAFSKSTRIGVDPMNRGMKFGGESAKYLAQAKAMNPNNPRIYFLQGQSAFYTPEQFGGGKKVALGLFQTSVDKFGSFKPKSELMPTWGKEAAVKMLEECK